MYILDKEADKEIEYVCENCGAEKTFKFNAPFIGVPSQYKLNQDKLLWDLSFFIVYSMFINV